MTLFLIQILAGFAFLLWSADKLVLGSANLARQLGMPPVMIGLTIIALGTSAPEILLSLFAALNQKPVTAVGNAIGSNIANTALVLGCCALIKPLTVNSQIIRRELPLLLIITCLAGGLILNLELSRLNGLLLMLCAIPILGWFIYISSQSKNIKQVSHEMQEEQKLKTLPLKWAIFWLTVGLVVLPLSADILIQGAVGIAKIFGISDLVIGLTILALGTSLPELAASGMSTFRNHTDIAVGNVVGSNLFNLTLAMGPAGIIAPTKVPQEALHRDMMLLLALTILLTMMARGFGKRGIITKIEGGILALVFFFYLCLIGLSTCL